MSSRKRPLLNRRRRTPARVLFGAGALAAALVAGPPAAFADVEVETSTWSSGAPAPGVDVPTRVRNPGESQQLLMRDERPSQERTRSAPAESEAGPSRATNPYQTILERRESMRGDGEGGENGDARRASPAELGLQGPVRLESDLGGPGGIIPSVYQGRVPGVRELPRHINHSVERRAASRNQLKWIGFQPRPEGARVFLETRSRPEHQVVRSPDGMEIRIRLRGTENTIANHRRAIEAQFFGTPVARIRAERGPGDSSDIVITLQELATPDVRVEGNTLFVDFPPRR